MAEGNTIRRYGLGDLGEELSGKNQMIGTADYSVTRVPLRRWDIWKWAIRLGAEAAVLADAGIAWSKSRDLDMSRTRGGLGACLRLLVPGSEMVRLDVGWSPEFPFHFHLASGSKPEAQRARLR